MQIFFSWPNAIGPLKRTSLKPPSEHSIYGGGFHSYLFFPQHPALLLNTSSISSRLFPRVSGTQRTTKVEHSAQAHEYSQKVPPGLQLCRRSKDHTLREAQSQFVSVERPLAKARMRPGKSSPFKVQGIGPRPSEKPTM